MLECPTASIFYSNDMQVEAEQYILWSLTGTQDASVLSLQETYQDEVSLHLL